MENTRYKNYFKSHYKSSFSEKDIINYGKWFYPQWSLINNSIKIKKGASILEIGSGLGGFYKMLSNEIQYESYIGLEIDKDAYDFARSFLGRELFKHSSLESFVSKKEKYDYIFAFEVLEHLSSPKGAIQKIYSLLKPGGVFIGTSPYPFSKNIFTDDTHLFVLHPVNWVRLFTLEGFRKVEYKPMSFFPFLWRINKHLNMRMPFYFPFPQVISTSLLIAKK